MSPDDMLHWDLWDAKPVGGTYGYNEVALYQDAVFRHRYVLQQAQGDGAVVVTVESDANPAKPIANVTVILDNDILGTTGPDGTFTFHSVAGLPGGLGHNVDAQLYTGPQQPPPPPVPTSKIAGLPACPASPVCKQVSSCPSGYLQQSFITEAMNAGTTVRGAPALKYTYACAMPPPLPTGCALWRASKPATVVSGQTTNVVMTLCVGATCIGGVPSACQQNCAVTSDCDNKR